MPLEGEGGVVDFVDVGEGDGGDGGVDVRWTFFLEIAEGKPVLSE